MDGTLKLADGSVIKLANFFWGDLRSAFIFDPKVDCSEWSLFTYMKGAPITGASDYSTRAHTNVPRSGHQGLPRDWEMLVYQWSAKSSLPLGEAMMEFASNCDVQFLYNDKIYRDTTLDDLILGTSDLSGMNRIGRPSTPIHMREHLMYEVVIRCGSVAREKFRQHLIETRTRATVWVKIEGLIQSTVY
jgi:hypothetical protein